jgi:hypothetical protein
MYQQLAVSVFPADSVTTVTSGLTSAISDNIAVVLGILAFTLGLAFVFKLFRKATKGHI